MCRSINDGPQELRVPLSVRWCKELDPRIVGNGQRGRTGTAWGGTGASGFL